MKNKVVAKKYLKSAVFMFVGFALLSALIVFGIYYSGNSSLNLNNIQMVGICLAAAYVPLASYTGFCVCFIPIKQLSKRMAILLAVFNIVALAGITIVGVVMVIPTIIQSIIILLKK